MSVTHNVPGSAGRPAAARPRIAARLVGNLADWLRGLGRRGRLERRPLPAIALGRGVVLLALAAAAIVAIMVIGDAAAIEWQRGLSRTVVRAFRIVTDLGLSSWVLVPTGVGVLLAAAVASRAAGTMAYGVLTAAAARLAFVFAAVALPGLTVSILKRLIGRLRPYEGAGGPFDYVPWSWNPDYASLPSGHGTTVCATALALGALYPRLRAPVWTLALVVAASRTFVSEHYPSDVLAGALAGTVGALVIRRWFAARRIAFAVTGEGKIAPKTGPTWRRLAQAVRASLRG
ncbi:MAG: phosphatase PAP2 family protein [Variibacter sp.]|nr:phosphatase PAP2 family protein [Variibacter sp.]